MSSEAIMQLRKAIEPYRVALARIYELEERLEFLEDTVDRLYREAATASGE